MTYMNAYEMLKQVRLAMHVYDEGITQGTDTDLAFNNDYLMRKINNAQRYVYDKLFNLRKELFLDIVTATFSGSVYTLPWNFGRLQELRDENGNKVARIVSNQRSKVNSDGTKGYYYQKGNTYVLDNSGINTAYEMSYYTKPREIDQGRVTATGTNNITLDTSAKKIDDYYNNMMMENINSDWVEEISDYTSDRLTSVTSTTKLQDVYGIVSELPEALHFLIPIKAVIDVKIEHPLSKMPIGPADLATFDMQLNSAIDVFGHASDDIPINEILNDFTDYNASGGFYGGY